MRFTSLLTIPLLVGLLAAPREASAQITISFGARLGPEIPITTYSAERYGDWHQNYRRWTPVTLYDINGHYYRTQVRGARPVLVYSYNHEYFLPPQDDKWSSTDRRFDPRRRPTPDDYGRAQPYTPDQFRFDVRLGSEVGVFDYSPARAGDWRTNYRRWTPVTLYAYHGRYFTRNAPGARAVVVYRYQNEYFLPPPDQGWVGADRRYDYKHQPDQDDRSRARGHP